MHVTTIIQLLTWMFIYIPILAYNCVQLWRTKSHIYFQKRNPILIILMLCILTVSYSKQVFNNSNYKGRLSIIKSDGHTAQSRIIDTTILDALYIIFGVRVWLLVCVHFPILRFYTNMHALSAVFQFAMVRRNNQFRLGKIN